MANSIVDIYQEANVAYKQISVKRIWLQESVYEQAVGKR